MYIPFHEKLKYDHFRSGKICVRFAEKHCLKSYVQVHLLWINIIFRVTLFKEQFGYINESSVMKLYACLPALSPRLPTDRCAWAFCSPDASVQIAVY